ncbi:MAG: hypothetical protein RL338_355 [Chloroflexota bacterium]
MDRTRPPAPPAGTSPRRSPRAPTSGARTKGASRPRVRQATETVAPAVFEALTAEARASVERAAAALRDVHDRFRDAYHEEFVRWQALRDELDALERRARARSGEPLDRSAASRLATRHDELTAALGRRRTELAKLELVQRSLSGSLPLLDPANRELERAAEALPVDVQLRVVQAHEDERARLAQEIHDGPAQALSNAVFQVEYIERVIEHDVRAARSELRLLRELLRRELGDIRSYITQLRPPRLLQLGLYGAIAESIESFTALTGIDVEVDLAAAGDEVDEAAQTVVLRIVQEALQNARKHAGATRVSVRSSSDGTTWQLEVRDDGRGFDLDAVQGRSRRSFGLQFMRERAQLVGAGFEVRSRPDGGTVVALAIPIRQE